MESLPVQDQIRAEKKQMQASLGAKEAVQVEGQLGVLPPPMLNAGDSSQTCASARSDKSQETTGATANLKFARSMLEATLSGKTARELLIRDPDHQRILTLLPTCRVIDAVKALGDWNVLGAPLVDRKVTDCVVGFIDVFDMLYYLVEQQPVRVTSAGEHYPPGFLGYEIHPDITVGEVAALIKVQQRRWKVLPVTVSAIDAIRELCAHQRLVLVDAASGAAKNIISQSSVLHWLAKQLPSPQPSGSSSGGNAELAKRLEAATLAPFVKRVRTVHVTDRLRSAIHQLVHTGFSAIAVTDPDSEAVVGELKMSGMLRLFLAHDRDSWRSRLAESAPKITDFQYDAAAYLEQSALDAAARPTQSDHDERPSGDGAAIGLRPECGWGMTILALERNHARQANIVDEASRCIGIVSLTDIMSALFGNQ